MLQRIKEFKNFRIQLYDYNFFYLVKKVKFKLIKLALKKYKI